MKYRTKGGIVISVPPHSELDQVKWARNHLQCLLHYHESAIRSLPEYCSEQSEDPKSFLEGAFLQKSTVDGYAESLKVAIDLCNEKIAQLADQEIPESEIPPWPDSKL